MSTSTNINATPQKPASTDLLRSVLDAVSDRVVVLDAQGTIQMVNAAWRQAAQDNSPLPGQPTPHTGIGADYLAIAAQGMNSANCTVGGSNAIEGIRAVMSGQSDSFNLKYPCHAPDQQRWFNMRVTPIMWSGQRGAVVAHSDITPQNLVEEALKQGELRFRTLFDSLPHVSIQGYGPDGTTRYWNRASEKLYGFTAQEAVGVNLLDLIIPPEIKPDVRQAIAQMAQSDQPIPTAELTLQRKDGSRVPVLSSHALIHIPGQPAELFCVDIDLSARKQAEDALRESEQRFRSIANATPVMIWLAGTDTRCSWFNAGWLAFTGRTMVQEQGNGWAEGVHPDDLQRCVSFYLTHFEQRLPFQMEYRLMHCSGQYRWIHDSGVPRFDAEGVFLGYIGSCVDAHEVRTVKDQLAAMAEAVPGVVYQFVTQPDEPGQFRYLSKGIESLYGVSAEAAYQNHNLLLQCIVDEEARADHLATFEQATRDLSPWQHEHRIKTPQGVLKWVHTQATPQLQQDGSVVWSGLVTDISAHKELEARLRQGASVFANVQEAIVITDAKRHIIDVNAAFTRTTGYSRADVLGQNPRFLKSDHHTHEFYQAMWQDIATQDFWIGEVFNKTRAGEVYAVILNISVVKNEQGLITHYVGVATDINQLKAQQELLERVAHYDALTQLPNRVLLSDRLRQAIAQARRNQTKLAVCYLDLDGFKHINDTQGHDAGDAVLKTVAQRMNEVLRASDTAARIGGDEFVVLLSDLDASDTGETMLERLLQAIGEPLNVNGLPASVGASIGVSIYPDNALEADTLLRQADIAMYEAKDSGKNCYRFSRLRAEPADPR
jgi:diguanylate cyclase (GGDEF)-like protein/PAS domain S-box-containing protein